MPNILTINLRILRQAFCPPKIRLFSPGRVAANLRKILQAREQTEKID
uniref:Uncharacterized protein n=1 Tax=viral metagenome TaxID=1070528 RepID=A0A6C0C8X4_9ZZZZ